MCSVMKITFCYGEFLFVLVLYFSTHELSSQGAYQEISQFFVTHVIPAGPNSVSISFSDGIISY